MAQNMLRLGQRVAVTHRVLLPQTASYHNRAKIGNRDVVGFGFNGEYSYGDHPGKPLPAIRFRENTPDVLALRQKEKGDWKKLTLDEKKTLYRASFCQTYSEMKAPTGVWKTSVAAILVACSLSLWFYAWMKKNVFGPLPASFSPEAKELQLKRMIDMRVNPIDGLSSHWDYEKNRWKE